MPPPPPPPPTPRRQRKEGKIGLIGLPNAGRSSFFHAISETRNIRPNKRREESRVSVPDSRFDWLCDVYKPNVQTPAHLTFVNIPSYGTDGDSFFSHVRSVAGIFHIVRAFDAREVLHVEGKVDPLRDMEIIQAELRLKDIECVENALDSMNKTVQSREGNSQTGVAVEITEDIVILEKMLKTLAIDNRDIRSIGWDNHEVNVINSFSLLTAKPMTYLININEKDYIRKAGTQLTKIRNWINVNSPGDSLAPFCAKLEERLSHMDTEDKKEEEAHIGALSALPSITQAGFSSLGLIRYFTCGVDEVRVWTIRKGTKAPHAAGSVHSDFEKTFLSGEIISFKDMQEYGSEAAARTAGKLKHQGELYGMVDGDIVVCWKARQ